MADRSKIEWTNATWSPTLGCTKVSPGCDNCYAIKTVHRLSFNPNPKIETAAAGLTAYRPGVGPVWTGAVHTLPDRLDLPLHWRKPRMIFVDSQSDLFHERVPDEFIAKVFAVMSQAPHHTFQVLSKRHGRMRSLLNSEHFLDDAHSRAIDLVQNRTVEYPFRWPLPNVWLGVSVESQRWANTRIPALLDTPAAVRWLSCEPLLGPIDLDGPIDQHGHRPRLTYWLTGRPTWTPDGVQRGGLLTESIEVAPRIDWVVVGGESGNGSTVRPMHPDWARSLRDQCTAAGVPFLFKQWGEWGPAPWKVPVCDPAVGWHGTDEELAAAKADSEARGATHAYASWAHEYGHELYQPPHKPWSVERDDQIDGGHAPMRRWGKKAAGRELDGRIWDEYPHAREVTGHG